VSWRGIGCLAAGFGTFIVVAVFGIWISLGTASGPGCSDALRWQDDRYLAVGSPAASPTLDGAGEPVLIGRTLVGIATRDVYAPAGSEPLPSAGSRPGVMAVACGDGTFQTYEASE
jgi:hypothetical protein